MKINENIQVGKRGMSYLENILTGWNWLFTKVEQEEDYGVDAIIGISENNILVGEVIGLQVKTGESYFCTEKKIATIPIGNHYEYWKNYKMPLYGVVVDLNLKNAYWVNIKEYLEKKGRDDIKQIKFRIGEENSLNNKDLKKRILENLRRKGEYWKTPTFERPQTLDEMKKNLRTDIEYLFYEAIHHLKYYYSHEIEVWKELIEIYNLSDEEYKIKSIIDLISEVLGNPDIFRRSKEPIEVRLYIENTVKQYKIKEIIKLLSMIDEENEISRGSLGQCVETIIRFIPKKDKILLEILETTEENIYFLRALLLLAYYNPKLILEKVNNDYNLREKILSDEIGEFILFELKRIGYINIY